MSSSSESEVDLPTVCVTSRVGKSRASHLAVIVLDDKEEDTASTSCSTASYHGPQLTNKDVPIPRKKSHKATDESVELLIKRSREEALVKKKASEAKRKASEVKRKISEAKKREKEMLVLKRAQERAEKKKQKEIDAAVKKAAKESSKENKPGEVLKRMLVILDTVLAENVEFMKEFVVKLNAEGVTYQISESDENEPGSVRWKRIMTERTVDEDAKVIEKVSEVDEDEIVITLEAQGFMGLVQHSKKSLIGESLPAGAKTLEQFVEVLKTNNPKKRISLVIEGIEAFLRGHKTRINRQFRQAVLDCDAQNSKSASNRGRKKVPSEATFSDVSRLDCEEALVRLQLKYGCVARMCEDEEEMAHYVISLTKALCESHFQKECPFSFYTENGQGPSRKDLEATDNKVSLIWKHQLMQFNNISLNMAAAVVAEYPSPAHLIEAYNKCSNSKEAENLLKDIIIRRGVGLASSSRRLGPVQSKRIYTMFSSRNSKLMLS